MGDYNLSGLSTRSFEQLIQALALKIIGPGVSIFGDGPDGGREATFDGPTSYSPFGREEDQWNGYGIIQAKFLQRPKNSTDDGDWALNELKTELRKFTHPKNRKRKPDYYIFATNIVLTPVEESGSQDKVKEHLNSFAQTYPLKGYDIWHFDKISRYLDGDRDTRCAYAAWITPGDVLAQILKWFSPKTPNFETIISNFLQKEFLNDQSLKLEQAGHTLKQRISIDRVFVDLPALDQPAIAPPSEHFLNRKLPPGLVARVLEYAHEKLTPTSNQTELGKGKKPVDGSRIVLIGGPGQGKSTLGQFLCQLFRVSILKDRTNLETDVEESKRAFLDQCKAEELDIPTVRRFPVRVVLNDFAAKLASDPTTKSLLSYLVTQIGDRTNHDLSPDNLREWLRTYPWLLILDGLDEVPASSNRDRVLNEIKGFFVDINDYGADVLVLATTRPQGYNNDFSTDIYHHLWLAPLSPVRALHYANRLVSAKFGPESDTQRTVLERLKRASEKPTTAKLMESPLHVTIMAALLERLSEPPQERWNLFSRYYQVIYERELADRPASTVLSEREAEVEGVHQRVGLLLQIKSEQSGETNAQISSQRFEELVENQLKESGFSGSKLRTLHQQIFDAATKRLVFLGDPKPETIGFVIRPLQEFMAAWALMIGNEEEIKKRLRKIAPISAWRNVFLFAVGKCFKDRNKGLLNEISKICTDFNDPAQYSLYSAIRLGSQLALELLEEGSLLKTPNSAKHFIEIALHLLDVPKYLENNPSWFAERLASIYTPDLENEFSKAINSRISQSNPQSCLGAWACLSILIRQEVEWAEELETKYWPTDPLQQLAVFNVCPLRKQNVWIVKKMIDLVPHLSPLDFINSEWKLSFLDTKLTRAPLESEPKAHLGWLSKALEILRHSRISPPILEIKVNVPSNARLKAVLLFGLPQQSTDNSSSLEKMPNPSIEWILVTAIDSFVINPSRESLSKALRCIGENYHILSDHFLKWVRESGPWLVELCLLATHNKLDLLTIANHIENGDMGDVEDWRETERIWVKNGISIEQFRLKVEIPELIKAFQMKNLLLPFPYEYRLAPVSKQNNIKEQFSFYFQLQETTVKQFYASFLLLVWRDINLDDQVWIQEQPVLTPIQFQSFLEDASSGYLNFPIEILQFLEIHNLLDNEWMEVIDSFARKMKLEIYTVSGNDYLTKLFSQGFCSDPTRLGILKILKAFTAVGNAPNIPLSLLDPDRFNDPDYRESALIIQLALGFKSSEATDLAMKIADLVEGQNDVLELTLHTLSHRESNDAIQHFLIALQKQLLPSKWHEAAKVTERLQRIQQSQRSQLNNFEIWQDLGFSHELHQLLE
ncbi:MAG: hypothetical protein HY774_07795 [Acidobacteria bacterium]|nr:hypothetical protein [Acidobacteriota bacterium]